jgi:hypothetical protein
LPVERLIRIAERGRAGRDAPRDQHVRPELGLGATSAVERERWRFDNPAIVAPVRNPSRPANRTQRVAPGAPRDAARATTSLSAMLPPHARTLANLDGIRFIASSGLPRSTVVPRSRHILRRPRPGVLASDRTENCAQDQPHTTGTPFVNTVTSWGATRPSHG